METFRRKARKSAVWTFNLFIFLHHLSSRLRHLPCLRPAHHLSPLLLSFPLPRFLFHCSVALPHILSTPSCPHASTPPPPSFCGPSLIASCCHKSNYIGVVSTGNRSPPHTPPPALLPPPPHPTSSHVASIIVLTSSPPRQHTNASRVIFILVPIYISPSFLFLFLTLSNRK